MVFLKAIALVRAYFINNSRGFSCFSGRLDFQVSTESKHVDILNTETYVGATMLKATSFTKKTCYEMYSRRAAISSARTFSKQRVIRRTKT